MPGQCPKCGAERYAWDEECPECGIIYEKYEQKVEKLKKQEEDRKAKIEREELEKNLKQVTFKESCIDVQKSVVEDFKKHPIILSLLFVAFIVFGFWMFSDKSPSSLRDQM